MNVFISNQWDQALVEEFNKSYFKDLQDFLNIERQNHVVYPPKKYVFEAFKNCDFNDVKVVVLGQDPYHGPGQAHGLSFSVMDGVAIPKSLRNIYKELQSDLDVAPMLNGNLTKWSQQGVLLLNSILTVRDGEPGSHQKKGWEIFTNKVIKTISQEKNNVVFVLWGNYAKSKKDLIDFSKHCVIESVHPSPLSASRGFFGSKPFSKINSYLKDTGQQEINW